MTEAIAEAATEAAPERRLDVEDAVRDDLRALPSFTIQKLLRMRPGTGVPAHGPDTPLPYDVVVVDEASMLDVALMRKLVEAIGPSARLLLLGDRDQLASVDAGTVLADVVAGFFAGATDDLSARVVFFEESHRFREAPLVGRFASLVQTRPSDPDPARRRAEAAALLTGAVRIEVPVAPPGTLVADWHDAPDVPRLDEEVVARLAEPFLRGYAARFAATLGGAGTDDGETHALLEALEAYRVLCTHRSGPRGVAGLNRGIGQRVRAHLDAAWKERRGRGDLPARGGFWLGLPVLVTENAYGVDLRNGDVGLVVRRGRDLEVAFLRAKGSARYPGGVQRVPIGRMPTWAPAFALTIHKGQGSQYAHVAVVLAGRDSPIETRELVYTGITRAKRCVTWVGSAAALSRALDRPVNRMSALGRCLGEALGGP